MKNVNQRPKNKTSIVVLLFVAVLYLMLINIVSFSQENDGKYGFIAIFKDTVMELSQTSEKEFVLSIVDNDIRRIINRDSVISLNSDKDTIWTFDIAVDGRRCSGTAFSGPLITKALKKDHSSNIIFLYSSLNALDSRLLNGMLIYISEGSGWQLTVKTE